MPLINTYEIGKVALHYHELDSTNAEAIRLLHSNQPPKAGTVIRADYQTAGRGQAGNYWHSSLGQNLLFSVVLYPEGFAAGELFRLTQVLCLSVAAVLQKHFENQNDVAQTIRIKWPNDVYVGERKIAGILVQNSLQGQQVKWSVAGVGLNVNESDFPTELQKTATSLRQLSHSKESISLKHCLAEITATLKSKLEYYGQPSRYPALDAAYHSLLYRRDIPSKFRRTATGTSFAGTIRGVQPDGRLQIEKEGGAIELFDLKSIAFER
ncbi:MAG: biotin--[acetyl-CoA-carboxylase] ligase [Bacteroidota bacterium]